MNSQDSPGSCFGYHFDQSSRLSDGYGLWDLRHLNCPARTLVPAFLRFLLSKAYRCNLGGSKDGFWNREKVNLLVCSLQSVLCCRRSFLRRHGLQHRLAYHIPAAQTLLAVVCISRFTFTAPSSLSRTPTTSSPKSLVLGSLPVAIRSSSPCISNSFPLASATTTFSPFFSSTCFT